MASILDKSNPFEDQTADEFTVIGDYIGTVQESFWSTPIAQSEGKADFDGSDKIRLYWLTSVDDIYQEIDGDVPPSVTRKYSIGGGWETEDGKIITHKDDDPSSGKVKPFNRGSTFGQIFRMFGGQISSYYEGRKDTACVVADESGPVDYDMKSAGEYLVKKFGLDDLPRRADTYIGMKFRFRMFDVDFGQMQAVMVLPVAYLGQGELLDKAPEEVSSSSGNVDAGDVSGTLPSDTDAELVEKVTNALNSSTSHADFVRTVIPWGRDNAELMKAITDEDNGPWKLKK